MTDIRKPRKAGMRGLMLLFRNLIKGAYLDDLLNLTHSVTKISDQEESEWLKELQDKLNSLSKEEFEKLLAKYDKYDEVKELVSEDLEEEIKRNKTMEKEKIKAIVRLTGKEVVVTPEQDSANEFRTVYRSDSGNIYLLEELDLRVEPDAKELSDVLTEQAAYDEYQERSKMSGDRAEQLAWAMIALLTGQLIGGSKYAEFYVLGGAALLYLLLSTMQSVWQSVTIWLVKCRIKRTGIRLNDYPDWVGFGAWVFYWMKMIIIAIGAIYGASHFVSFAM